MLSVEEAQERVLAEVMPMESEEVALFDALGRVLRENILAPADVPQADNSAMDGYAVRAADLPGDLRVIGDLPAGTPPTLAVEPGTAIRIMTGALVPEGADTVVHLEVTETLPLTRPSATLSPQAGRGQSNSQPPIEFPSPRLRGEGVRRADEGLIVRIPQALPEGTHIRKRGEDMRTGDTVLHAGSVLRAGEIGVLAGVQKARVNVGQRPVIAILSTGDELVEIDQPREFGKVVNSNSWALEALVREAGAVPRRMGIVRDTREATIAALEAALDCDFILTSGGVSVGAWDFVKDALEALGAETKFWRVAMKPGKPVVLSTLRGRLVFGLPGNPVSCMVSFQLFVAPAIRKAMGQTAGILPPRVRIPLAAPMTSKGDRRAYMRVRVAAEDGALTAHPMRAQGSGVSTSMLGANGFAVMDEGVTRLEAGGVVDVVLFGLIP
jgi:molybdopterin molybdotransferase